MKHSSTKNDWRKSLQKRYCTNVSSRMQQYNNETKIHQIKYLMLKPQV